MQIINPAYVGVRSDLSLSLLSRQQWVGIQGSPTTNTFSINGRTLRGLGIGATFVNDKIGLLETNNINFDASYTLITSRYSRLSLGLKGGVTFFNNNLASGITPDNDIYASTSGKFLNVGFGALFYNNDYFVGLSIPYLLETPQFYIQDRFQQANIAKNPNIFLSAGSVFEMSEDIMFKPSTMVRYTTNLPITIDVNTNFLYRDVLEAGVSYRHKNSISALLAVIVNKQFRMGYTYEQNITAFGNFNSHELMLHIDFDFQRNSRWLQSNRCFF